jgi:hypothetical protein
MIVSTVPGSVVLDFALMDCLLGASHFRLYREQYTKVALYADLVSWAVFGPLTLVFVAKICAEVRL